MLDELDHTDTEDIVCPHCGYEYINSIQDYYEPDDILSCEECGGLFEYEFNGDSYTTWTGLNQEGEAE